MNKFKPTATASPESKASEPATYAEAVAQERASWGDSWQGKHDPLPTVCLTWKIAAIDLLRPAMFGAECHRRILAARVRAGGITEAQAESKATSGDATRAMIADWTKRDWDERLRRGHLAVLVSLKLLPQPKDKIVRQWLDGAGATGAGRGPIDHDQRMADAEGIFDADDVA